jgi:drug/metabolite transporter (DMT)-like permease
VTISNSMRGILMMLAATASFVVTDTLCKLAMNNGMQPMQALFLRNLFATLFCLGAIFQLGLQNQWRGMFKPVVAGRSTVEFLGVVLFFVCLSRMPIAELTAILQIAPLMVLLAAALIYREQIGPIRVVFILVGFAGAIMVANPGQGGFSLFALLGLVIPFLTASRDIFSRNVPISIHGLVPCASVILLTLFGAGLAHLSFESWTPIGMTEIAMFAAAGFFLLCGQFLILGAFRVTEANIVAPYLYSFMLWAVISGVLVFSEIPKPLTIAGMAAILVSGIALMLIKQNQSKPA